MMILIILRAFRASLPMAIRVFKLLFTLIIVDFILTSINIPLVGVFIKILLSLRLIISNNIFLYLL